ncbi:MAG: hypothetical protein ACPGJV_06880 [Bacteriovoracaceae bacterium]
MEETIARILENSTFTNTELLNQLLRKCIHISNDSTVSTYAIHDNLVFKIDTFFKNLGSLANQYGKNRNYQAVSELLENILTELGLETDKKECFLFYHLRDLGKFRKREEDMHQELKVLWKSYPEFEMDDLDFSYSLKNLMRSRLIGYRRGKITLNPSVIIRYRTRG